MPLDLRLGPGAGGGIGVIGRKIDFMGHWKNGESISNAIPDCPYDEFWAACRFGTIGTVSHSGPWPVDDPRLPDGFIKIVVGQKP